MTPPDKCPHCQAPTENPRWPGYYTCGSWYNGRDGVTETAIGWCILRQRDALAAQIESLKNPAAVAANVLRGQIAESRGFVGDHRALLEACGTYEIPEAVAAVERLKARVKELEAAGDALVADNRDMGNLTRWHRAREGKP